MKLYELLENNAETSLDDIEIVSVTDDTRKIIQGSIFFCIKGEHFDGHTMAEEAVKKGAVAVVCERDLGLGELQIITENSRTLYGKVCSAWFGHPEKKLKMIGVTGTNGKTTITSVIKHILTENGHKTGLIGTIQNEIGNEVIHTDNTTPFTFDFMELLDRMVKAECEYVVMEVSSFGLVQNRTGSAHFDIALFTNLTQDHLDYHKTMEDYYQAKKILFGICDKAFINIDDEYGKRLFDVTECEKVTFSVMEEADFYSDIVKLKPNGSCFRLCNGKTSHIIKTNMVGLFNVSNTIGAIAVCLEAGIAFENIIASVMNYGGVKGRCEVIPTGRDFTVICDYAHTPDALENVLQSINEYKTHRLVCLFGCGGNRDKDKRPKMALSASKYADKLIITSDNPRDEKPEEIIKEILGGLNGVKIPFDVATDRRNAIYHALQTAEKGDIIVLAGKGHEDYQILADGRHIHFDEREVVADGLKLLDD
ncbi:MAG: UDP-N-acetylmuramoyl-L-alanyl-D-glutamate--2,6-diaminopimelate ligase [Ruminococcus sp.]|nr:UDP-N-acetylmuramoyl-L-alanyl-D-glutamate--2,6-diaminopimelate ligase [Ruminococcus sp.]